MNNSKYRTLSPLVANYQKKEKKKEKEKEGKRKKGLLMSEKRETDSMHLSLFCVSYESSRNWIRVIRKRLTYRSNGESSDETSALTKYTVDICQNFVHRHDLSRHAVKKINFL